MEVRVQRVKVIVRVRLRLKLRMREKSSVRVGKDMQLYRQADGNH